MRIPTLLLLLAACRSPATLPTCADPPAPAPRPGPVAPPTVPAVAIAWTAATWPELGLGFATFTDMPIEKTLWRPGGVTGQGIETGVRDRVRWLLRSGLDESLGGFRADHRDWTFTQGTPVSVCGQRVGLLVATHAEEHITCVMTATGNHPLWIPPRRAVALEFLHRGVPVVVSFEVESEHVEAWRAVEAQFLAGLRCL